MRLEQESVLMENHSFMSIPWRLRVHRPAEGIGSIRVAVRRMLQDYFVRLGSIPF